MAGMAWADLDTSTHNPWYAGTPKIVCEEPEFTFGIVKNTEEIVHDYVIRNEGDGRLEIRNVLTDCGCVLIRPSDAFIEPGRETTIKARFALKGRNGKQRKRITVESNDRATPRLTLHLVGEAWADVQCTPDRLYWGNIRADASLEKSVNLVFHGDEPRDIIAVESPSAVFITETDIIALGEKYTIKIRAEPPLPLGPFQGELQVFTDHPAFPVIRIPMQGRVVGELYTLPDEILVDPRDAKPVSRFFAVKSSSTNRAFKLVSVNIMPPDTHVTTQIRPMLSPGFRVELRNIPVTTNLDDRWIVIKTDLDSAPELRIPIRRRPSVTPTPTPGTGPEDSHNEPAKEL